MIYALYAGAVGITARPLTRDTFPHFADQLPLLGKTPALEDERGLQDANAEALDDGIFLLAKTGTPAYRALLRNLGPIASGPLKDLLVFSVARDLVVRGPKYTYVFPKNAKPLTVWGEDIGFLCLDDRDHIEEATEVRAVLTADAEPLKVSIKARLLANPTFLQAGSIVGDGRVRKTPGGFFVTKDSLPPYLTENNSSVRVSPMDAEIASKALSLPFSSFSPTPFPGQEVRTDVWHLSLDLPKKQTNSPS